MKNKTLSFLLVIASIILLYISTKSGIGVFGGMVTIGKFFTTIFIADSLATLFVIASGYLTLKNSKKLKTLSKKTSIFLVLLFVLLIIAVFMTVISRMVDSIIVMGNFRNLVLCFIILDISILVLGFSVGIFLNGVINKNVVDREKILMVKSKHVSGNTYRYIFSFIIPIIGYILGAILLSKDDETAKNAGKNCIVLGIISTVLGVVAWLVSVGYML